MHQVGLSQSRASIQEKRIISIPGGFRHGQTGRMGEFVVASYNKGIKTIL